MHLSEKTVLRSSRFYLVTVACQDSDLHLREQFSQTFHRTDIEQMRRCTGRAKLVLMRQSSRRTVWKAIISLEEDIHVMVTSLSGTGGCNRPLPCLWVGAPRLCARLLPSVPF